MDCNVDTVVLCLGDDASGPKFNEGNLQEAFVFAVPLGTTPEYYDDIVLTTELVRLQSDAGF